MGAVLKAKDNNLARTVALKVMLNSANANEHTVFNFVAEAQITGQLEHPNIVPLHDIGVASDGTIYYTMKLIEGRTLRDILKDIREGNAETIQGFPISRLLTIFQKVCDGMSYAHSRGVIHRDLKPDNVMIGEFGEVLILDWGIAKVLPEPGQAHTEEADGEFSGPLAGDGADASATMAGQLKGTPNYMALSRPKAASRTLTRARTSTHWGHPLLHAHHAAADHGHESQRDSHPGHLGQHPFSQFVQQQAD